MGGAGGNIGGISGEGVQVHRQRSQEERSIERECMCADSGHKKNVRHGGAYRGGGREPTPKHQRAVHGVSD